MRPEARPALTGPSPGIFGRREACEEAWHRAHRALPRYLRPRGGVREEAWPALIGWYAWRSVPEIHRRARQRARRCLGRRTSLTREERRARDGAPYKYRPPRRYGDSPGGEVR